MNWRHIWKEKYDIKIKNHKLCCIVIILALLGGGGFGIYKFFFQKKQPQKTVQTQKATTGTIEKTVEGSGSSKSNNAKCHIFQ